MPAIDKPITIQSFDELTEDWTDIMHLHASINKTRTGSEFYNGGAVHGKATLTFEVRYSATLAQIEYNSEIYRIIYDDQAFNIIDYDDYRRQHRKIRLVGVKT